MKNMNKISRICLVAATAALSFALSACTGEPKEQPPAEYPVHITAPDGSDKNIILEKPQFIGSLSPSTTQILNDIGLGGYLVAISDYCPNPLEEGDLEYFEYTHIGSPQIPNVEAAAKSRAQVIFTTAPLSPNQMQEFLQKNIEVVVIPHAQTLDELRENYNTVFRIMRGDFSGKNEADEFWADFEKRYNYITNLAGEQGGDKSVVYIQSDLLKVATGDTLEGQILADMGFTNWGDEYSDYNYPTEQSTQLDPDIIFYNGTLSKEYIASADVYKTTKAVKNSQLYLVPSSSFEMQNPKMLRTMWQIGTQLYPQAFISPTATKPDEYEGENSTQTEEDGSDGDAASAAQ